MPEFNSSLKTYLGETPFASVTVMLLIDFPAVNQEYLHLRMAAIIIRFNILEGISPLLANLFLHYAFDYWMQSIHPDSPFERYADDIVAHCKTEAEGVKLKSEIAEKMKQWGLELHPHKTKIVYCKDTNRTGNYIIHSFDFLGFCFRPRPSRNRHSHYFVNFSPAIAPKSKKVILEEIRQWRLHRRSDLSITDVARWMNPVVRGWLEHYGAFFQSELLFLVQHL